MKDTNYTIQTSKDNYVTYTTSRNKEDFNRMNETIIDGVNVKECMFILDEKYLKTPNCTLKISQN